MKKQISWIVIDTTLILYLGMKSCPIFASPLSIQQRSVGKQMLIAEKYNGLMNDIESLKQQIASASSRKQAILDKYLK